MIETALRNCETEQEFDTMLDDLRHFINMAEDNIAEEKGWME